MPSEFGFSPVSCRLSASSFGSDAGPDSNSSLSCVQVSSSPRLGGGDEVSSGFKFCSQVSGWSATLEPPDGSMAERVLTTRVPRGGSGWVLGSVKESLPSPVSALAPGPSPDPLDEAAVGLRGARSRSPAGRWLWLLPMLLWSSLFLLLLGPPGGIRKRRRSIVTGMVVLLIKECFWQAKESSHCRLTFTILVSPPPQYPGQCTQVCVALTGADVAGSARTHGTHVVHRRLRNWIQE